MATKATKATKSGLKKKTSKKQFSSKTAKRATLKATQDYTPSQKEILNGEKVLSILENIEDIGYTLHREDLFTVIEPEFGLEITVDAEDEVICLVAEICEKGHLAKNFKNWSEKLLELNNTLLHGAFAVHNEKVLLRENLAAENLDPNELEDALSAMFIGIIRCGHALKLV